MEKQVELMPRDAPAPGAERSASKAILFVILAGIAFRLLMMFLARGTLIDDAYITLRYGRNLFLGRGMVYNPGERVLGAPPFYIVWLGFLWQLGRGVLGEAGTRIGYLVTGINILLMAWAARLLAGRVHLRPAFLRLLPLVAFCMYLPFADNTNSGMETTLFVLLLLLSGSLLDRGRDAGASAMMGLAALVRPEGTIWIASVLLGRMRRHEKPRPQLLLPCLAILGSWAIFCVLYFGTPIPQNALAKSGWITALWGREGLLLHVQEVLKAFTLLPYKGVIGRVGTVKNLLGPGWMILPLAFFILGTVKLWRERGRDLDWSLFFILYVLLFVIGRGAPWPSWYAIPPGLALVVVGTHGASVLLGLSARWPLREMTARRLVQVMVPGLALTLGLGSYLVWHVDRLPYYGLLRRSHGRTGCFLATVEPQKTLLVMEMGLIGYLADRHVEDMAGIVSRKILDLNRRRREQVEIPEQVVMLQPDYISLPRRLLPRICEGEFGAWFERSYQRVFEALPYQTFEKREDAGPPPPSRALP